MFEGFWGLSEISPVAGAGPVHVTAPVTSEARLNGGIKHRFQVSSFPDGVRPSCSGGAPVSLNQSPTGQPVQFNQFRGALT